MDTSDNDTPRVTLTPAAQLVDKSAATINNWVRKGWLPCERTSTGLRLFEPSNVIRVAHERARRSGDQVA